MSFEEIDNGIVRIRVAARGAALCGFWHAGWARSVVLGTDPPEAMLDAHPYAGAVVGPVANRVTQGQVQIAGKHYAMPMNAPGACLHSGPDGLHARQWTLETRGASLTAQVTLADGACGLPGNRRFQASYALEKACLTVTLVAWSDADTLCNLALHPYFNLDGTADLARHRLAVGGAQVLETADGLPTGRKLPVQAVGLAQTLTAPHPGVDHNVCLTRAPAAVLTADAGPTLTIGTDAPGLQVYGGAGLPTVAGSLGAPIGPGAGLALEPQMWPDAPHHAAFPSILLRASQPWRQITTYHLDM